MFDHFWTRLHLPGGRPKTPPVDKGVALGQRGKCVSGRTRQASSTPRRRDYDAVMKDLVSAQAWAPVKGGRAGRQHIIVKQPDSRKRIAGTLSEMIGSSHKCIAVLDCFVMQELNSAVSTQRSHSPRVALATHGPARASPRCRKPLRIAAEVMCRDGYPQDLKCLWGQGSRGQLLSQLEETEGTAPQNISSSEKG